MEEQIIEHPTEEQNELAVFNMTEGGLIELEELYKKGPGNLDDPKQKKESKAAQSYLKKKRVAVEKRRKEKKAFYLEEGRKIDNAAKSIMGRISALEDPYAIAIKEHDTKIEIEKREKAQAEEKRIDDISERISNIKSLVSIHVQSSSSSIKTALDTLAGDLETAEDWGMEFADKAKAVITEEKEKLSELFDLKLQQENSEKLAAEAEEKRKVEEEARKKAEEEERIKREADLKKEQEKLAAEKKALEEQKAELHKKVIEAEAKEAERKRKEQDRIDAEKKKEEDQKAEAARIEEEKKAKAESEAKAKEEKAKQVKKSGGSIYSEEYKATGNALLQLTSSKTVAKQILDEIISGNIPHLEFTGEK